MHMIFKKISSQNSKAFRSVWRIYLSSFSADERRQREKQIKLFADKSYRLFAIFNSKDKIAEFMSLWNLKDFIFIEHFAVKKVLRNKGMGKRAMKEFMARANKMIILEVEEPNTKTAKKRIRFYSAAGFKLNKYDYVQPAYGKNKKPVKLFLMSFPKKISKLEFCKIRKKIYSKVYKAKWPAA